MCFYVEEILVQMNNVHVHVYSTVHTNASTHSVSLWYMYTIYALCSTQGVMKDRWMNIGFEEDELKPYMEPKPDLNDQARIRESTTYIYVACC